MKIEQLCTRSMEFRASDTAPGDGHTLEGYAAVFGQDTEINSWEGHFTERIAPGSFKKTLRERKPVMQFDHGRDARTGSVPIGAFDEIKEDGDVGLFVRARVFDNPVVEPIRQAIEAGAISGMSFKFRVVRDEWRDNAGKLVKGDEILRLLYEPGDRGPLQRTIKEVQLSEAGPVVFPAYAGTSVGVRDMTDADRESLAAQYRKTMLVEDDSEQRAITAWLDAEKAYTATYSEWLRAESDYATSEWLRAESEYVMLQENSPASAVPPVVDTPAAKSPEDAGRSTTSRRVPKWKVPEDNSERNVVVPDVKEKTMNLEQLKARMGEIALRLAAIGEEHRDAELPAEAATEWDALEAEGTRNEAAIKAIETRMAKLAALATDTRYVEKGTPSFIQQPEDIYDVQAIRKSASDDEDFQLRMRDNAMRAVEAARYSRSANKEDTQGHIEHLLNDVDYENGALALRLLETGTPLYERAFSKAMTRLSTAHLSNEEQRALAMTTNAGADGGLAVPFQLDPTVILTSNLAVNPLRQLARVEQITGKQWNGITSAGISVARSAEAAAQLETSPTLASPSVIAQRVAGWVPFSLEVDQDWAAMRSEISRMLQDAKDREEANSFTLGDGTGVNANGIITTLSGNTVAAGAGSIAQTTAGYGLLLAALYAAEEALDQRWLSNANLMASRSFFNKIRQIDTAGGAALWERIGAGQPQQLLGYSTYKNSNMAAPTTNGAKVALLGDFSQFLIVDRIGMNVELVPHVFANPSTTLVVPTGQRGFFAVWRNNSKILVDAAFKLITVAT